MFKKIFFLFCLVFLANCSTPGTAFLGPIFTGAKTGSIYQTSLSYSTGKIMNELNNNDATAAFGALVQAQDIQ